MSDNKQSNAVLTEGPIGIMLLKLTVPMTFGLLSMILFNLVDTFFVSRLGTFQLAALSFTFPVVLIVGSLGVGLGTGASALISRAIGEGNEQKVRRLTTDSLTLSFIIVVVFAAAGFLTIKPLFMILGAPEDLIPMIKSYMSIWYVGVIFVIFPMVGNNAIRATGDMKTPAIIMMSVALLNAVLDPFLIFGIWPFPRLEISGAALSTVLCRAVALVMSMYVIVKREKMISFRPVLPGAVLKSWKNIMYISLPTAVTRMAGPVALGIITRVIAGYGPEYVAGFGVSSKIEFFSFIVIIALSTVINPFIGQNRGAGNMARVKRAVILGSRFSVVWGIAVYIFLNLFSRIIAGLFSKSSTVESTIVYYLQIAAAGFAFHGLLHISTSVLNVLKRPLTSAGLIFSNLFLLYIPLSLAGSYIFGIKGIFWGIALSYTISGALSYIVIKKVLGAEEDIINTDRIS
jgi:putative MATE family efflux protein